MLGIFLATTLLGDSLELRNGKVVTGTYVKADGHYIWLDVGGTIEPFAIDDISKLTLQPIQVPVVRSADVGKAEQTSRSSGVSSAGPTTVTIPGGTLIAVRLVDAVVSSESNIGRTFQATVNESLLVMNQTVIPKGSSALVRLIVDKQSTLFGRKVLALELVAVKINGSMLFLDALKAEKKASQLRARLASGQAIASIAIGAMAGARNGGIYGAAIGAVVGVSVEAVVSLLKRKQTIPAETLLYFVLQSPTVW